LQFSFLIDPADEVVPEGHDLHESPSKYVLAGQELLHWDSLIDPAEEVVPEGHDSQESLLLFPNRYWLAEHLQLHLPTDPADDVVPSTEHDLHESDIMSLYWLAGQGLLQLDTLAVPALEVPPEGHDLHESPSLYVLAGHLH